MKNNQKGFTLAELLIVVAIIAVLVAVAIPVFTTQLEKSREATDLANIRTAYSAVQAAALMQDDDAFTKNAIANATFTVDGDYSSGKKTYTVVLTLSQTTSGWQTAKDQNLVVAGTKVEETTGSSKCTIVWSQETNETTITFA